jgi:GT2 family glycosyltransferase
MKPQKTGIVILNYLNYQDAIECVLSALKIKYINLEIIVVENGSPNESYSQIHSRFKTNKKVHIIRNSMNLGFSRGHNTGIQYARKHLECEFVFCVNNDVIFNDTDIISKLIRESRENFAVVGPKIIGRNKKDMNPVPTGTSYRKLFRDLFCAMVFSIIDIEYLRKLWLIKPYINIRRKFSDKKSRKRKNIILHGSALFFTPLYFKHFPGLYPGTFLYYEENILSVLLKNARLNVRHVRTTSLMHKEDMSSTASFGNKNRYKSRHQIKNIITCIFLKLFKVYRFEVRINSIRHK